MIWKMSVRHWRNSTDKSEHDINWPHPFVNETPGDHLQLNGELVVFVRSSKERSLH